MADRTEESGFEFVLDNRRLVIAFAVLMVICGCFFVLGFIEGKRQGFQEGVQTAAESSADASPDGSQAQATEPAGKDSSADSLKEGPGEQQLDWYKNMSRREGTPGIVPPTTSSDSSPKAIERASSTEPAVKTKTQVNAARSEPVTYSVQVGAFRQREKSEARAEVLRAKGYDCRVEPPNAPEQLYLLKVGRFNSRAEAIAMQLRLKKSGFTSAFIKTN